VPDDWIWKEVVMDKALAVEISMLKIRQAFLSNQDKATMISMV